MRIAAGLTFLFGLLTVVWLHPLWTDPGRLLNEVYDVRLNAWILAWDAHAVVDPAARLWDANIFHPHGTTLAFSENLIGTALLVAPLNWAGEPVLAYNAALFLAFVLTGLATALWIRKLTGNTLMGLFAGVAFAFGTSRASHLPHLQLLVMPWIPLLLLCLHRWVETRRSRWVVAAAVLGALQFAAGIQLTLVLLPALAIYGATLLLHTREGRRALTSPACLRGAAVAIALGLILVLPIGLPYLQVAKNEGFVRDIQETRSYAAQPNSLLATSTFHQSALARWQFERYSNCLLYTSDAADEN